MKSLRLENSAIKKVAETAKAEGLVEGESKKAREVALCLLENSISISLIVTASGLSEEEIRSLRAQRPT